MPASSRRERASVCAIARNSVAARRPVQAWRRSNSTALRATMRSTSSGV
jgi:hypothetical protein